VITAASNTTFRNPEKAARYRKPEELEGSSARYKRVLQTQHEFLPRI